LARIKIETVLQQLAHFRKVNQMNVVFGVPLVAQSQFQIKTAFFDARINRQMAISKRVVAVGKSNQGL